MTYRALLIGNSTFDADAGLNPLNAPTKDVARLHRALVDEQTGLFDDDNVRLVTERTSDELLDELDAFFESGRREDLLLMYYSGHGLIDQRNQLYLCGRNTRSDRLLRTAVSNTRINEFIAQSVARCTVILLDCCASGMFKGGDIGAPLAGPGRYIVSSTRGSALANDAAVPTGTSLFTEYLVTGLLGEAKDRNDDGYVDLREIYDYVRTQLAATTKQVPHCRFDGDAEVTLARRPGAGETPVLSKVSPEPHRAGPVFALSENAITLRDVDPDERLRDEVVEIYPLSDAVIECTVETSGNWLMAELRGNRIVIHLRPVEGPNRSKIMVRDLRSGTVQALRVEAYVRRRATFSPPPTAETPTKGPAAPPQQASGPPVTEPRAADRPTAGPKQSPPPPSRGTARIPQSAPPGSPPTRPSDQRPPAPAAPGPSAARPRAGWRPPENPPNARFGTTPGTGGTPVYPARTPDLGRSWNRQAVAAFLIALAASLTALWIVGAALAVVALTFARQAQRTNMSTGSSDGAGLITAARVLSGIAIAIAAAILIIIVFNS